MKESTNGCILSSLLRYTPPSVEMQEIKLEEGLAKNSTVVSPGGHNGSVDVDDWGDGGDIGGNIEW